MSSKEAFFPEARFGGFTDIDGTIAFYNRVNSLLDGSLIVLDVGCGRGAHETDPVPFRRKLRNLKGKVAKVIGIDLDAGATTNPFLDEFRLIEGETWPLETDSVDLIICDDVLEHVPDPERFFREIQRVLKSEGCLCIRTPNRWGYPGICARLIPNKYHSRVTSVVQDNRDEADVFPTLYKLNTIPKLRRMLKQTGFTSVVYGHEPEPSYLSFSSMAYFFGVVYEKIAPGYLKSVIFAFGRIRKEVE